MKATVSIIKVWFEAFLSTWAITRIFSISSTNILPFFLLLIVAFFYIELQKKISFSSLPKKQKIVQCIVSGIFTFFYIAGDFEHIYTDLDNILFRIGVVFITTIGLFILFSNIVHLIFFSLRDISIKKKKETSFPIGIVSSVICFLCYIPYLGKNFPGVMTIDSINQFAQVVGAYAPSNHHPYVHTLLIGFWYSIGQLFTENISLAISFYTIFQMICLSMCVGYCIHTLSSLGVSNFVNLFILAFYGLMPYNGHYAVTIWKDPLFAGGTLLFLITLLHMLYDKKDNLSFHIKDVILFCVSAMIMCLFRTNGWYAFLLTIPFLLFVFKKQWKTISVLLGMVLCSVLFIKGPVMNSYHVIQPDLAESLSIPGQQLSRVIVMNRELTEEQWNFLNQILDTSEIASLYNPYVSDGFKKLVRAGNMEFLEDNFMEFLQIYLEIGFSYPLDYVTAFRDQSIGFWFPLQEGIIAGDEGVIENEFGVTNMAFLKGPLVIKINEIFLKLKDMIPVYGLLWNMGAMFWLIILSAGICSVYGNKPLLLLYIPCFAVFLTLVIATPVAKEFRYAYSYIYCFPLYMVLPFLPKDIHKNISSD